MAAAPGLVQRGALGQTCLTRANAPSCAAMMSEDATDTLPAGLLSQLSAAPVGGVPMGNVCVLRLDLLGGHAPGNKCFKLKWDLAAARGDGVNRLVSFGGAWSNHLHALAALGHEQGFETIGLVRGEADPAQSEMLRDAAAWGMQIVPVERADYRRRNEPLYLERIRAQYAPCRVIPEGGASAGGARGCMAIADLVRRVVPGVSRIALAVGTGTTLAGMAAGLNRDYELIGVAALKGATDLAARTEQALADCRVPDAARWQILHHDHCGGFARVTDELRDFTLEFESVHGIPLEPVYTAKMLLAVQRRLRSGEWDPARPLLAIHTGGLQGRRGFGW